MVVDEIGAGTVVLRVPIEGNTNHLGTMYAGALFALAELPGGLLPLAVLSAGRYVPIVTDMQVRFTAAARSDVTLAARMDPAVLGELAARADAEGQASFVLHAEGRDAQGRTVLTSTGHYALRPARAPRAVDTSVLAALAEDLGDAAVVVEALGIYLEELPGRLRAIEQAAAAGQRIVVKETAHTLKSASRMVGAGGPSGPADAPLLKTCSRFESRRCSRSGGVLNCA